MKTAHTSEPDTNNESPFKLLDAMQKQVILNATEPPRETADPAVWQGIRFTLGERDYVVGMDSINEVIPEPVATPLPGARDWVKGIANLKGRLITIVDLNRFLDVPVHSRHHRHTLVINNNGVCAGLLVDKAHGIMEFPKTHFDTNMPEGIETAIKPFTQGSYHKEQNYPVFSADRFINSQQFLAAAKE